MGDSQRVIDVTCKLSDENNIFYFRLTWNWMLTSIVNKGSVKCYIQNVEEKLK